MSREHSAIARTLLGEIGLTDGGELWALTAMPPNATGAQQAAVRLAMDAALAIGNADDADRHARQHLATLGELHTKEAACLAGGLTGDARWLAQAAERYAEALARLQAAITAYRAAAHPLALILGLTATYDDAKTATA